MAWLCEAVVLPAERFLGSGGGDAEGAILAGHVSAAPEIWEALTAWLDADSDVGPWLAHQGRLVVEDTQLACNLAEAGRGYDLVRVRQALAPFDAGARYQPKLRDGTRPRVTPLDVERLARALPELGDALRARIARAPTQPRRRGRFAA